MASVIRFIRRQVRQVCGPWRMLDLERGTRATGGHDGAGVAAGDAGQDAEGGIDGGGEARLVPEGQTPVPVRPLPLPNPLVPRGQGYTYGFAPGHRITREDMLLLAQPILPTDWIMPQPLQAQARPDFEHARMLYEQMGQTLQQSTGALYGGVDVGVRERKVLHPFRYQGVRRAQDITGVGVVLYTQDRDLPRPTVLIPV